MQFVQADSLLHFRVQLCQCSLRAEALKRDFHLGCPFYDLVIFILNFHIPNTEVCSTKYSYRNKNKENAPRFNWKWYYSVLVEYRFLSQTYKVSNLGSVIN